MILSITEDTAPQPMLCRLCGRLVKEETLKRAVERSKLDRKTNIELVETMWNQFNNLGKYESNVIDTTNSSIEETVLKVKTEINNKAYLIN